MTYKELYAQYLLTPEWTALAAKCKERDGYKCRLCGSTRGLAAHHFRYPAGYNWKATTLNQVVTLCEDCHKAAHRIGEQCDKYEKQLPKEGYILRRASFVTELIYSAIERIIAEECWRRNYFTTAEVAKYGRSLVLAAPKYGERITPPIQGALSLLAFAKDCTIANHAPCFDVMRRRLKRLGKTRFK